MSHPNTQTILSRIIRTILSMIAGMLAITLLVESIEFALVAWTNGGITTDPKKYFAIRNQNWFLAMKLVYNLGGAVAGGFVVGIVARYAPIRHGFVLAVLQTAALGWALTQPQLSKLMPLWMWSAIMVVTFVGIIIGARLASWRIHILPNQ